MTLRRGPHRVVTAMEERLAPLEAEFHRAYWDSQIEASEENDRRRAELELQVRQIKGDGAALEEVKAALDEGMHEPILRRQLELLRLSLTANQMDEALRAQLVDVSTAVESTFANHRPEVDGRRLSENEIDQILHTSSDESLRRRAWAASKDIGRVVGSRVRELARLRNEVALSQGYPDHYRMALDLQELSESWLFGMLDELDAATAGPYRAWKEDLDSKLRDRFGVAKVEAWHYADPFFQQLPPDGGVSLDHLFDGASASELAERTFAGWGIDVKRVLSASDLFPRERKCQHAFCLDIDRSTKDVRILANVVPGERWVEVMLHESGHAAYDISIDKHLPYLLRRAAHTFVTEAMAILSGRLPRNPEWLSRVAGFSPSQIEPLIEPLRLAGNVQSLLFTRWVLVMAHFERDLYLDPEADLDERWWDYVERFQFVERPQEGGEGAWAAKIHVACAPVYYHNYLLGEVLASQLEATMAERFGGHVAKPEAGRYLVDEVFRHGASIRWDRLIENATDRPLTSKAFVTAICG